MDETDLDVNLEALRDFVSPAIFNIFSGADPSTSENTMNTLDDHNPAGNEPPPTSTMDESIDALLLDPADDARRRSWNYQLLNVQGWIY